MLLELLTLVAMRVEVLLIRFWVGVLGALDVHWCSLSHTLVAKLAIGRGCTSTAVATCRFDLEHLLLALLAELFQVDLHDILDDRMHLGLVLHDLSDVDNLFALEVCQEVAQTLHNFLIAALVLELRLGHS